MPENPAALHVLGVTGNGRLLHTIRTPGGWAPFVDVLGSSAADQPDLQGYVTEVTAARVVNPPVTVDQSTAALPEALVVAVLVSTRPNPLFFYRYAETGQWVPLGAAAEVVGARRIAATAADAYSPGFAEASAEPAARLHLGWTGRGGRLLVTRLRVPADGHAITAEATSGLNNTPFRVPALAGRTVPDEKSTRLRLAGLTADGRMYRSVVTSEGASELLSDVETAGAGEAGEIVDTALAIADLAEGYEYYAAVTGDGRILLATYKPGEDSWMGWRDLEETDFVLLGQGATVTYRDIAEFGTFARVALATTSEGLHVLGVTTSGQLLHQLQAGLTARPGDGQQFRDVELTGVGSDVGEFIAVAAA